MSVDRFWDSSMVDIQDTIESYTRKKKDEIMKNFTLAEVIANRIAMLLPSETEVSQFMPWDYYPRLYESEKVQYEEHKRQKELEEFKNRRRDAMDAYNAKYYGGGENG